METISVIVPCYNEENAIPIFHREISNVSQKMKSSENVEFELIFIDDGSSDQTLQTIRELHVENLNVRYVSFSRNFGKEAGIYAGLQAANGDYIAIMDVDLQDPPPISSRHVSHFENN